MILSHIFILYIQLKPHDPFVMLSEAKYLKRLESQKILIIRHCERSSERVAINEHRIPTRLIASAIAKQQILKRVLDSPFVILNSHKRVKNLKMQAL